MLSAVIRSLGAKGAGVVGTTLAAASILATAPVPQTAADPGICNTTVISAGGGIDGFSLAIARSDGSIWAWGSNAHGQLGDNSTASSSTPVQVKLTPNQALTGAISVSAGSQFALALDSNGSVFAWGDNSEGQLGVPNVTQSLTVTEPLAGSQGPFVAISAGGSHSLALDQNGNVWVWGNNLEGQLGLGPGGPSSIATPTKLPWPTGVIAISAGDTDSFALDQTGQVWAWGFNGTGELGDGTQTSHPTPTPASITGVNAIFGGTQFAMARKVDGSLWAWGDDQFGELGNSVFAAPFASKYFTPAPVPFSVNGAPVTVAVTVASAGDGYALAVTSDAGGKTMWGWGNNVAGQLGTGDTNNQATPTALTGMGDVTQVSAGFQHALALHADDSVSMWGGGILRPQPVLGLPAILQPVPPCGPSGTGGGPIGTSAPKLSLSIDAPASLTWMDSSNYGEPGTYSPNPVPVNTRVQNVGNAPAQGVKLTISLETGLTLASGEGLVNQVDSLAPGASYTVQWHVQVPLFPPDHTYLYTVRASAANAFSVIKSGSITVPKVPRRIVFVHGIGTSFAELAPNTSCDSAQGAFMDRLRHDYKDKSPVVVFRYYQDAGYQTVPPTCQPPQPQDVTNCQSYPLPDTNVGHLYVQPAPTGPQPARICDSGSDLAYNAAMLDDLLATYPGPQTIIGYSEGGAITRGWLSLDRIDRPNSIARKTVDTVIFIQVPQGGSWLALKAPTLAAEYPELIKVGQTFADLSQKYFGVRSLDRPAVRDVLPGSLWYASVNLPQLSGILPGIHYYNFYTDIKMNGNVQVFGATLGVILQDVGDGVIRPIDDRDVNGNVAGDNPGLVLTVPAGGIYNVGNSRFLPGFTVSQGQFQFSHYGSHSFLLTDPTAGANSIFATILNDPYSHASFLPHYDSDSVLVQSCIRGQGPVHLITKIEQIINSPANACNP